MLSENPGIADVEQVVQGSLRLYVHVTYLRHIREEVMVDPKA